MNKLLKFSVLGIAVVTIVSCSNEDKFFEEENADFIVEQESGVFLDQTGKSQDIEGQFIVVFDKNEIGELTKSTNSYDGAKNAVLDLTGQILGVGKSAANDIVLNTYAKTIMGVTARLSEEQVDRLSKDSRVSFIEQDRIVQFAPPCGTPNGGPCDDPGDGGGGTSTQETPWGISRVNGGVSYSGSNVAWVLDSGIDLDHPDLNVDASRGFNAFTSGKDGKSLDDGNGHGTHVSGTIGALDNTVGVIGVAAGATVIPVKVLDSRGSGAFSGVIAGVDHVAVNGSAGDVANMSLGGPISAALESAIHAAAQTGVRFMLAAGNESQDANNVSPARLNGNNIYTISSMAQGDNWSSFSNFGNPPVDYCAPGSAIKSTWKSGGYNTISGTSMATPHAAGVLLLGNASTSGTVNGDPDGNSDLIITH